MGAFNKVATLHRWLKRLPSKIYVDYAGDDLVFIAGSGRSGTSWLANICNYKNSFRYLFEPLNPSALNSSALNSNDEHHWCLRADAKSVLLDKVLTGKISNAWVNSRNRRFFARRRLIKEIRANLMLAWIHRHYPAAKLVLILRNPLAVAASKKSLASLDDGSRWVWEPSLSVLLSDPELRKQLTTEEYQALNEQIGQGVVMESVADWCINNLIAIRSIELSTVHVVYYETLLSEPEQQLSALMKQINVEMDEGVFAAVNRQSETTRRSFEAEHKDSAVPPPQLNAWQQQLTSEEQRKAMQLLSLFNIERFYSHNWQPMLNTSFNESDVNEGPCA